MKKIMIPILAMVLVFSLVWIAGAQVSSSGSQSGSSQQIQPQVGGSPPEPYKSDQSGSQTGSSQQYGTSSGSEQSGTGQQYRGKESQERGTGKMHGSRSEKMMEDRRASKWIGMTVRNQQGEDLGKIEDLVISSRGQVEFVVVEHGGTLGMGEKYTAVPFKAFSKRDNHAVLNISKEKMAEAPSFDKGNWPDMSNRKWSQDVYRYYGQKPYWSESTHKYKPSQKSNKPESSRKME